MCELVCGVMIRASSEAKKHLTWQKYVFWCGVTTGGSCQARRQKQRSEWVVSLVVSVLNRETKLVLSGRWRRALRWIVSVLWGRQPWEVLFIHAHCWAAWLCVTVPRLSLHLRYNLLIASYQLFVIKDEEKMWPKMIISMWALWQEYQIM